MTPEQVKSIAADGMLSLAIGTLYPHWPTRRADVDPIVLEGAYRWVYEVPADIGNPEITEAAQEVAMVLNR